jgi:hypothetical protein
MIRDMPHYRREAFVAGLRAVGYDIVDKEDYSPGNICVVWNRYGHYDVVARRYEEAGLTAIVAENGYLGRDWRSEHWYALAKSGHNGAGKWKIGGPERWNQLNVELAPWRETGTEIVVLATRHIGVRGVAEPYGWTQDIVGKIARVWKMPVRVRQHPGENKCVPLEQDLRNAKAVVSWGSGAALKALTMGVPVAYGFKNWIGADAATPIDVFLAGAWNLFQDRAKMFQRLAWAMWNTDEIATGGPFKCLLA